MKNKKYWRKRFEQLQEKLLKPSDDYVEDLDVIYSKALNNIHNDLNKWYLRFMDNNGIVDYHQAKQTLNKKELKELRWTLDDYIKYGQENAVNEKWIHELENASARVHITRLEALELQVNNYVEKLYSNYFNTTNSLVRNTIENSYYGTIYEISKGLNVKFDSFFIDKRKIDKLIAKPWSSSGENFSSNIWKNKDLLINNLHKNLVSGLISNKTPDKIIADFSKSMKSSRSNAARVIMTENAYFSILGQEECYSDLGIKKFEIVGTLDKTTCKHCGSFDGKVVNIKEFEAGVTVPPFHPYCRCTTVPYFNDEFTQDSKRIARDKDGNTIYVNYDMNYEDWKKDYLKNIDIPDNKDNNISNNKVNFDLNKILQDIKELSKNAPIGLRFCLENQLNINNFIIDKNWNIPFGYDVKSEKIIINPFNDKFCYYDIKKAITHEIAHKIDLEAIQSYVNIDFIRNIKSEIYKIDNNLEYYKNLIENTDLKNNMAISDIFSALSKSKINGTFFHTDMYWNDFNNISLEIFANLFQVICINDIFENDILNKELPYLKDTFLKLFI